MDRLREASPPDIPARGKPVRNRKPTAWTRMALSTWETTMRRLYPCAITGLEHYSAAPATLAVSNHRRDSDGPLIGSVLLRRMNGRIVGPLPNFVAREDLFERGFLAHYLRHCPAGVRSLLKPLNVSACLTGAHPLQRIHERSVAGALQDVIACIGDLPASDVLRPRAMREIAASHGLDPRSGAPISRLLRGHDPVLWRRRYGYRQLRLAIFRRIRPCLCATINRQMDYFAHLLERGEMLILEPEGRLSLDGGLRRPRAALHRLINQPDRPVRLLPISITYDSLTLGQPRVFIDIQPELTRLRGLSRHELDERVMAAIRAGCRVTGAQLAAAFFQTLPHIEAIWTERALIEYVYTEARSYHGAGLPADPCLLDWASCEQRVREIIAWGRRKHILKREGNGRLRVAAAMAPPPWLPDGPSTLLDYLRNELREIAGNTPERDPRPLR